MMPGTVAPFGMNFFIVGNLLRKLIGKNVLHALWLLLALSTASVWASGLSAAFYYGQAPFPPELRTFDTWVVEPANISDPTFVTNNVDKLFAYVSLGEVTANRPYLGKMPETWLRGDNKAWQSRVIDQAAPGWPLFFVDEVIAPLRRQGFRNFFLDTLDSYHLIADTPEARKQQEQGMIAAIRLLKSRFPDAKLTLNRGFEILPEIRDLVTAVAAESLFQSWNNMTRQYLPVSASERDWLLKELGRVRSEHGLPVIVIDYAPPGNRTQAREIAARISALGFVPWVSNGDLNSVGLGTVEPVSRRVLMLYDGRIEGVDLRISTAHRYAAMPLNYLGYVPEYRDIAVEGLPETPVTGRYAGIVTWFHSSETTIGSALGDWLLKQVADDVPVVILDNFGFEFSEKAAVRLGLKRASHLPMGDIRVLFRKPSAAFETEPLPTVSDFFPLDAGAAADVWLRAGDSTREQHAVAITAWGGYALAPFSVIGLPDSENARWVVDPIAFLKRALKLPDMPVPDVTTENGRRLLITHIDGDGFASKAEFPKLKWAGDMLYDEILLRYPIPTTVSVIEGETAIDGRYPQLSAELEPIARKIFALPYVEAASHSFSHPFRWEKMADNAPDKYSLGIPGYAFDEAREIEGSVKYVNSLLPPGKRCEVFLWTGNCMPGGGALARSYQTGLLNMNGGETTISRTNRTLTAVAPLGISEGGYFQVFAPNQNENRYTNLWTGPFYGYERVIETFELTEKPARLKPINIYYHTYSASKPGSLRALKKVYDWALKQPVLPVHASVYIRKVLDFNDLAIAREGDAWRIEGGGEVRTLRLPVHMGYPDLVRSRGILGWWDEGEMRYIHLSGTSTSYLVLTEKPIAKPWLARANGRISVIPGGWKVDASQPLELEFGQAGKCRFVVNGKPVVAHPVAHGLLTVKHSARTATVEAHCGQ
jgi:polysaccharide biosynthesis protein PelA